MPVIEKLGLFYLGKIVDPVSQEVTADYLFYDSKDLCTHAVCVGMTGSGKTGLCTALLEEAAIDGIPAIVVDPKGDLANLALLFPELRAEEFGPWINEAEAAQKGLSPAEYAHDQADLWRRGLAEWDQDTGRIQTLLRAVDISIYTPGSSSGLPLSVLKSFAAPPEELRADTDLFHQRVSTTVTGLLGLLGIQADPLQSREHILLANLLESAWNAGESLDLPALIQRVQSPPLRRVGVFELDSFYPAEERFKLAMLLNNLLAAPGFASWLEGDALEIDSLLFTPAGKPRLSILSIAHLTDPERMFFVTLLLNQLLGWMRKQAGTASLRALFYMDEIFGFFPPVSEPASKRPLLTLLKQARAFGLGLVLTTQNPVDLDYKGLANTGTWFIGRLQTENDKQRLLDGLAGVGGNIDLRQVSSQISGLKKRVFLMHDVHEDRPVLMNTRWTLSYLRGPLTRQQISQVMAAKKSAEPAPAAAPDLQAARLVVEVEGPGSAQRPQLPPGVSELFVPTAQGPSGPGRLVYHPALAAFGQAAIIDNRLAISSVQAAAHYFELTEGILGLLWDQAKAFVARLEGLSRGPQEQAFFLPLPERALRLLKSAGSDYGDFLVRTLQLNLWKSPLLQVLSGPGETERDFRVRLAHLAREKRDATLDTLRQKYAPKIASLERQLLMAEQRLQREQEQYRAEITQAAISTGATILGAILGRKTSPLGRATTSARGASRSYYQKMDIERAKKQVEFARSRLAELQTQLEGEAARMVAGPGSGEEPLQAIALRPKKKDVAVQWAGVLWLPFWHLDGGSAEPGFRET